MGELYGWRLGSMGARQKRHGWPKHCAALKFTLFGPSPSSRLPPTETGAPRPSARLNQEPAKVKSAETSGAV